MLFSNVDALKNKSNTKKRYQKIVWPGHHIDEAANLEVNDIVALSLGFPTGKPTGKKCLALWRNMFVSISGTVKKQHTFHFSEMVSGGNFQTCHRERWWTNKYEIYNEDDKYRQKQHPWLKMQLMNRKTKIPQG